jgi:hypothetical protein
MAAPRFCTTRRAVITIVVTFVTVVSLNYYVLIYFKYVHNDETGKKAPQKYFEPKLHFFR